MKTLKRILCALMLVVLLSGTALASGAYRANVITSSMEVYNYSKQYIGSLPRGTEFFVLDISDDGNWAKVYYNGKVGFTSMQNIFDKRIPVIAVQDAPMFFVTKTSFKLGKAFNATIAKGTPVYMVGYFNGYLLVENSTGNGLAIVRASNFRKL